MTILSRDRLLALHRAPSLATNEDVSGILDMLDAMQRALEAWRDWCLSSDGIGGERFDNAIELTAAAGIDMEGERE